MIFYCNLYIYGSTHVSNSQHNLKEQSDFLYWFYW